MLFTNVQMRPDKVVFETNDTIACPKCDSKLVRHLVWSQEGHRVFSYHCAEHGDVVPMVKAA